MAGKKENRIIDPNAPSGQQQAQRMLSEFMDGRAEQDELRTNLLAELVETVDEMVVTIRSCVDAFIDPNTSKKLTAKIEKRMEMRMAAREAAAREDESGDSANSNADD